MKKHKNTIAMLSLGLTYFLAIAASVYLFLGMAFEFLNKVSGWLCVAAGMLHIITYVVTLIITRNSSACRNTHFALAVLQVLWALIVCEGIPGLQFAIVFSPYFCMYAASIILFRSGQPKLIFMVISVALLAFTAINLYVFRKNSTECELVQN